MEMVAGGATAGLMAAGVVMAAATGTATGMGGGGAGGFEARCLDGTALAGAGGWGSATSNTDSLMVGVDSYGGGGWVIGYLLSGFNLSSKTIGCFSEKQNYY